MAKVDALAVEVRIADCEEFKRLSERLIEIAEADTWVTADEVRDQVREALEAFCEDTA